jgi:hypothetical protein
VYSSPSGCGSAPVRGSDDDLAHRAYPGLRAPREPRRHPSGPSGRAPQLRRPAPGRPEGVRRPRDLGLTIGTLYGHFPTRDALLEAATRDELAGLLALDVDAEPLTGLRTWVLHAVAFCSTYRGFVSTVAQGAHDEASLWREGCHAMETRGAELLAAAQRAGRVRREVTPVELFDLVGAAAWLRENAGPDHDGSTRLVDYVLDGISRP